MAYDRTEHILGYGKHLFYGTTNPASTPVYGTIDIQLPERELGIAEITNDDSPNYHKDYIPALYEPGKVPFTYRYGRTLYAALETIFMLASSATMATRATATKWWLVTLPDGSTAAFQGFLIKHDLPTQLEDSPVVEAEIQVIGKMTFTAGAGT